MLFFYFQRFVGVVLSMLSLYPRKPIAEPEGKDEPKLLLLFHFEGFIKAPLESPRANLCLQNYQAEKNL